MSVNSTIHKVIVLLGLCLPFSEAWASSTFLEEVISQRDGTSAHIDGPNCWNGALYATGVVPHLRFMHPDEWLLHIGAHCVEIEQPEFGSLGRIYHPTDGEVHGFVHLDQETIFAKHGESAQHGYQVMSYKEMLDQYGKTRSCRISNSDDPNCFHEIKYYRCNKEQNQFSYQKVAHLLQKIAMARDTKWVFKSTCDDSNFLKREGHLKEILALETELKTEMRESQIAPQFWSALLESFRTQIYNVEVSNRSFRCKPRKIKYQTVKEVRGMFDRLNSLLTESK